MKAGFVCALEGATRRTDSGESSSSDIWPQQEVRLSDHIARSSQVYPAEVAGFNNVGLRSHGKQYIDGNPDDEEFVEVLLDVHLTGVEEQPESRLLNLHIINNSLQNGGHTGGSFTWERKASSFKCAGRTLARNASARIRAFSQDFISCSHDITKEAFKCFSQNSSSAIRNLEGADFHDLNDVNVTMTTAVGAATAPCQGGRRLNRSKSAVGQALTRLRFITESSLPGSTNAESLWAAVESRFFQLASPEGLLARADFAACIGMKESKDFAGELFDTLARKRGQQVHSITQDELRDYWVELTDQSFDNRLQLFFEM